MRRHENSEAGRIHEVKRNKTLAGQKLGPSANAAEMAGIAQSHCGEAVLGRALRRDRHSLCTNYLAIAKLTVNQNRRTAIVDDLCVLIRAHLAFPHEVDIARHAHQPMRIMSNEVRLDQMARDDARLVEMRAGRFEHALDQTNESFTRYQLFRLAAGRWLLICHGPPASAFLSERRNQTPALMPWPPQVVGRSPSLPERICLMESILRKQVSA
jgi:hypothetical protein